MLRKILIGVGVVVILIVVAIFYLNNRNRTLSPPGSTSAISDGMSVTIDYSRPSVRERLIFGEEAEGALQPYGVYWRLGANEPTFLEVNQDFTVGETKIPAGKYAVYAFPRKGEMELRINTDIRAWGYSEPDYEMDIAISVVPIQLGPKVEQFTITALAIEEGVNVVFEWDTFRWILPISKT